MSNDFDDDDPLGADEEIENETKNDEKAQAHREQAWNDVLSTPAGRRVVHEILISAGVFASSFCAGDPHVTSFQEGRRSGGLMLKRMADKMLPGWLHRAETEAEYRRLNHE